MKPEEIKHLRKQKKLTQTELGELCGVNKSSVSAWEKGLRNPSGSALLQLQRLQQGQSTLLTLSDIEIKLLEENIRQGGFRDCEDYLTASLKHLIQYRHFGQQGYHTPPAEKSTKQTPAQATAPLTTGQPTTTQNITPFPRTRAQTETHKQHHQQQPHHLPFLGAVAAGEPVSAPIQEELPVAKPYPPGHFIVEINGQSMEPHFTDGDRWIIDGRDKYTPKNGAICVVSDGYGSYLKKWNARRKLYESLNPAYPDILPPQEAKLQGYPIEKWEG